MGEIMKKNKKLVIILSVVLVILIGIVVVLFIKGNLEENGNTEEKQTGISVSTVEQQIQNEESFTIDTEYGDLYYPKKWESNIRTEVNEKEGYSVKFFGTVEGKEEQPLFEIIFNSDAEMMIGTMEKDGENIYVGFNFSEPNVDSWAQEDADMIYAMQEDVNYLIGMLEKEDGFRVE